VSTSSFSHARIVAAAAAAALGAFAGGGGSRPTADWPLPNLDLSSSRALASSGIDRSNVGRLRVAWRFRLPVAPGDSGTFTATPIVAGGMVYVQDMKSNVFALDLATGRIHWRRLFDATNPGPNGLAAAGGRIFGATDAAAFALDAASGRVLWRRFLVTAVAPYVDMAPQAAGGLVYVSTVGLPPNGRGELYALDASTGRIRWRLSTIAHAWRVPREAGGGGAWETPSVAKGEVYWGTTNPYPYGGTPAHPNGGAFAGAALYTDSLLVTDARSGRISWFDQVTPHDVRDYDFQLPPILGFAGRRPAVFGAGKAGIVIAWDRSTHRRLWVAEVGAHLNDRGPLPAHRVSVCPGLLGGVLTPMASAGGRLFVPVVDLCMRGSATGYEPLDHVDPARGSGELVALDTKSGRRIWTLHLREPDFGCASVAHGVVFTSTYDGTVYGVDSANGHVLWRARLGAGVNACPALASGTLLVGAGVPLGHRRELELTAFTVAGAAR
jgi:outer membrane protein assembly factor BamB